MGVARVLHKLPFARVRVDRRIVKIMKMKLCVRCIYSFLLSLLLYEAHAAMPCVSRSLELSLDDAIHISDVVLTGRVAEVQEGEGGTHTAVVVYYFAYKSDRFLFRLGLGRIAVKNFASADVSRGSALFFLVREPSRDLALLCMSPLGSLYSSSEFGFNNILDALNYVQTVGASKHIKKKVFHYRTGVTVRRIGCMVKYIILMDCTVLFFAELKVKGSIIQIAIFKCVLKVDDSFCKTFHTIRICIC